jgi:hypothetical protein
MISAGEADRPASAAGVPTADWTGAAVPGKNPAFAEVSAPQSSAGVISAPGQGATSEGTSVGVRTTLAPAEHHLENEERYWYWSGLNHKWHVATDDTCYTTQHPLCAHCNPQILDHDPKPWEETRYELVRERSGSAGAGRSAPHASGANGRGEGSGGATRGLVVPGEGSRTVVGQIVATPASWAYEPRQKYLARKLKYTPSLADSLIAQGLWTGTFVDGKPIPSDVNLVLWQSEVWPVYNGPEPTLNKMRSLRDTLLMNPECGPRLISAGLWTGAYDDEGLPVPASYTPEPKPARSRR